MKRFLKNWRIIILIVALLVALIAINPHPFHDGVAIRSVDRESAASFAGIPAPLANTPPVARERIIAINNEPVEGVADYYDTIAQYTDRVNVTFTIETNRDLYTLRTRGNYETIILPELELVNVTVQENVTETVYNETLDENVTVTRIVNRTEQRLENKTEQRLLGVQDIGLTVYEAPRTNIRQGLDLSGGTRVILQPEEPVAEADLQLIIENIKQRLNVFGLSDIVVRDARDLSGNDFIIVEIAGANQEEVRELLAQQGKFEATIANETVFRGGDEDITYVCRSADCSGLDSQRPCQQAGPGEWSCGFFFTIDLSPAAAERQAELTRDLTVVTDQAGSYLSEPIELYLDDEFITSLRIASDLQGRALQRISISGGESGASRQEAVENTLTEMRRLQTVLITGSLPVRLEIVKADAISPLLGQAFVQNAILIGLLAIIAVSVVVFIRYRELKVSIPMVITILSEATLILGFASIVGWNLDLAAIAAIIIAIGTGVDHQIVIADEALRGELGRGTWKERFKNAFFIITAAYVTTVAAMVPLWFAGAGILRGFAITTIVGVSMGVFITRPAFAAMVELLLSKE